TSRQDGRSMDTGISSWCSASGPCPDGNSPVGSEVINSEGGSRTSMSTMRAETLDNGLLILLAEQHTVPVAAFCVWYRVGRARGERELSCLSPAGRGRCRGAQGASVPDSCHWVEGRPAGDHPGRSVPPLPDVLSSQQRRRGRGRTV